MFADGGGVSMNETAQGIPLLEVNGLKKILSYEKGLVFPKKRLCTGG